MNKLKRFALFATAAMSFLTGCQGPESSGITDGTNTKTAPKITAGGKTVELAQTGYSTAVPDDYLQPIDKSGTVQMIEYESRDYARDESEITKTAYVYLPYGYDENDTETRYDICYLMHGWGGHAGEYFEYADIKEMLDNMIANGDIAPTIFVSATFYNDNSDTGFSGSVAEFRQFHRDFEEYLMPAVEGKFHTYAESTSPDDLKLSRDHRAFGGFSLSSVTTWLGFCYDSDYIHCFLPMSGSSWYYGGYGDFQIEKNVDFIEQLVKDNELNERGYFIYHGVGTNDTVKSQSIDMAEEMLSRSDVFTTEHYVFYQREGGQHDHISCREFMYNALPLFFGGDTVQTEEVTENTTVGEVKNMAAFGDFGRLLFPVDRTVSDDMTLKVDPDDYSLWGGSAGARMAAALGNADNAKAYGIPQAGAVIMQYTGYSYASAYDAPTYANVGTSDGIANWKTMQSRLNTLESYGIPTEFHAYEGLPHGFGLGTGTAAEGWINDAVGFWERQV